jgi:hypothetical protein
MSALVPGAGLDGGAVSLQSGGKRLIEEACIIFEGILLLCGPDDVNHMMSTGGHSQKSASYKKKTQHMD